MLSNALPICLLIILSSTSQVEPGPADLASDTRLEMETLLRQVPQTQEDIEVRIKLAQARLAALQPVTQPLEDAADEPAAALREALEALHHAWEAYLDRLQHFAATKGSVAEFSSEEHIQAVTDELSQLEEETRDLEKEPPPLWTTDEKVQEVQTQVQAVEARLSALAETQSVRSTQIAGGFQQQREQLENELGELRQQRQGVRERLDAPADTAAAPTEPDRLSSELRQLDVRAATAELVLQTLPLEQQKAELQFQQDERLLDSLRTKLETLKQHLSDLTEAKSRSRMEVLEAKRARATSPADVALLDLQLFCERVLLRYLQKRPGTSAPEEHFPNTDLERLKERVASSKIYWDRAVASLEYRGGDETLELRQLIGKEMGGFSTRLAVLREQLGETLSGLGHLQTVREKVSQRFGALADAVGAAAPSQETAERTRLETEVTTARGGLDEAMRTAIGDLEKTATRLGEAVTLAEEHIAHLRETDQRLHWKHVARRGLGLMGVDWPTVRTEWQALSLTPPEKEVEDEEIEAVADLERELFGKRRDDRAEVRRLIRAMGDGFATARIADWGWAASLLLASVVVGFVLYRVARWKGVRLAREIDDVYVNPQPGGPRHARIGSGLSARVDLMGWNLLGDLAIPLLAAGALVLAVRRIIDDETVRVLTMTLLIIIAGAIAVLRLVHHLFEADSPPHRPIPCRDTVARHYRLWLSALSVFSLIVLPVPVLFRTAQVAPALEGAILEVYKAGFLALLLLFLLRKDRVLGGDGTRRCHWGFTLAAIAYPVVVIVVVALLVLEVIGFGALVTFVGKGLLLSGGTIVVAGVFAEYIADAMDRYSRPAPARLLVPTTEEAERAASVEQTRTHYVAVLLKWVVRVVAVIGALLLILRVWNVPVRAGGLNWRLFGLSALVVLVALLIDRIIFIALFSLQTRGRLPASTANISRRWARGVLAVVVLLAVVAIAGFEIDSIWSFMTALLAMLAIGFVAVWSMLSNILATLIILIWRPFNVGERIEILPEGIEGQVIDINFIYTILKSDQGTRISIPNNLFAQKFIRRQSVRSAPKRTLAEQLESEDPLGE